MYVSRIVHAGNTLVKLDREERTACKVWDEALAIEDTERKCASLYQLQRTLDIIRERRRLILGIPLPGKTAPKSRIIPSAGLIDIRPVEPEQPKPQVDNAGSNVVDPTPDSISPGDEVK